jgi:hypothetical protein
LRMRLSRSMPGWWRKSAEFFASASDLYFRG